MAAFKKMGGRQRKSAGKKSTEQSSTTTTTDKDFGTKLQQNNIVFTAFDVRAANDAVKIRELLDQRRASEPPDQLTYNRYLVLTEDYENELAVEISAYPLLSKRTAVREVSGYFQRPNHPWLAVDNHLTICLSDARPDIVESYRKTDYPSSVVEALSGELAPSLYNEAMPAYTVEFKSSNGDMKEAKLQCAYDGAIMTEGARAVHKYLDKSDDDFYGKTQALTVAFNGETLKIYGHHALQIPPSSHPGGGVDSSTEITAGTIETRQYPQYLLAGDNPRDSFGDFQSAYKHIRNAEDIGFKWATERKDALWAYTNGEYTQTPSDIPISAQQPPNDSLVPISPGTPYEYSYNAFDDRVLISMQQPTDSLVPLSSGPPGSYNCNAYDEEADPTDQLLRESWTNSTANNQDFSMPIASTDNRHASPAPICNPIAPPQSSKDVSVLLEPQQLSIPTFIEPREDVDFQARSHRKTRTRTRHAVAIEGSRGVVNNSKSRKTRKR